jgi:DsbC/DsbD-like thiol-disulfide interchange protein
MRSSVRLLALCLALLAAAPLRAGDGLPAEVVRGEILGGWTTDEGHRMAALRLTLAPGWKTYWRAPGDAGIPPQFDWSGSGNLAGVRVHWPAPELFESFGMRTAVYSDEVVLPLELRPERPGAPIRLRAEVDLGVCETVCIPARLQVAADLDGAGAMDPAIRAALAARPMTEARAGVGAVECRLAPIEDGLRLDATIAVPRLGAREAALVEAGDPGIWVSEPLVARQGDRLHLRVDLVPPRGAALALDRSALRFTLLGSRRAVDVQGCD